MDRGLVVERVVVVGDGGDDWRAPSTVVVAEERRMRECVLHQLRVSDVRTLGRTDGRVEERGWPVFHGSESVEWNDVCSARRRGCAERAEGRSYHVRRVLLGPRWMEGWVIETGRHGLDLFAR